MKLNVNLPEHPYDVIIENGALANIGTWVSSLWKKQKIVLISDGYVNGLSAQKVVDQLENVGFGVATFGFPEGEASKNLLTAENAWNYCAVFGLTPPDGIIALGGG